MVSIPSSSHRCDARNTTLGVADAAERSQREQAFILDAHSGVLPAGALAEVGAQRVDMLATDRARRHSCRGSSPASCSTAQARGSPLRRTCRCWKFRVGSAPKRLNVSRLAAVPSSRYFAVAGPNDRFDKSLADRRQLVRMRPHWRAAFRARAIALMFFAPSTAPLPPRPAWRPSCEIVA